MPQEQVPIGQTVTLTQNQVYALPAVSVEAQTSLQLQTSLQVGSGFANATSNILTGAWVRCTTGNAVVTLRKNGVT